MEDRGEITAGRLAIDYLYDDYDDYKEFRV